MKRFYLVNRMSKSDTCIGRVLSVHKTFKAAFVADTKLQRMVRKNNGVSSYLPTWIVSSESRFATGDHPNESDVTHEDQLDHIEAVYQL